MTEVEGPAVITYEPIFTFGLGNGLGLQPSVNLFSHEPSTAVIDLTSPEVITTRIGVLDDEIAVDGAEEEEEIQADDVAADPDGYGVAVTDQQGPGDFIELPAEPEVQRRTFAARTTTAADNEEKEIEKLGRKPPWMKWCKNIKSPLLRLHQEIIELVELLQPTAEEIANRKAAVEELAEVVKSLFPSAETKVFGSFSTGLFVPTSDVDVVIMDSQCVDVQAGLRALAMSLARKQISETHQVIGSAKVPIVKYKTKKYGGLNFDVSFDQANGPEAADLVRQFMGEWPMMRPLVLVLKLFLQQRELNETYSGGIGSYALITLVAAFLRLHTSRKPKQQPSSTSNDRRGSKRQGAGSNQTALLEPSLGVLLVDFFRLFGRVINMPQIGISAMGDTGEDTGRFFRKSDKPSGGRGFQGWYNPERTYLLSVEDPRDSTNDITRNSYNIRQVKAAFDFAYLQLTAPCSNEDSLLARILRLGAIVASRKRPENILSLYTKPPPSYHSAPASRETTPSLETGKAAGAGGTKKDKSKSKSPAPGKDKGKKSKRDRDDRDSQEPGKKAKRG